MNKSTTLSEYLKTCETHDYALFIIDILNMFMDNPIPANENVISLFEEQIKNGKINNIFAQHDMKFTFDGCCANIR